MRRGIPTLQGGARQGAVVAGVRTAGEAGAADDS